MPFEAFSNGIYLYLYQIAFAILQTKVLICNVFRYIVKANICKSNKKHLWEFLLMLRKRFFPNIITIDIKTFDNHMHAILITVIKKMCGNFY